MPKESEKKHVTDLGTVNKDWKLYLSAFPITKPIKQ